MKRKISTNIPLKFIYVLSKAHDSHSEVMSSYVKHNSGNLDIWISSTQNTFFLKSTTKRKGSSAPECK